MKYLRLVVAIATLCCTKYCCAQSNAFTMGVAMSYTLPGKTVHHNSQPTYKNIGLGGFTFKYVLKRKHILGSNILYGDISDSSYVRNSYRRDRQFMPQISYGYAITPINPDRFLNVSVHVGLFSHHKTVHHGNFKLDSLRDKYIVSKQLQKQSQTCYGANTMLNLWLMPKTKYAVDVFCINVAGGVSTTFSADRQLKPMLEIAFIFRGPLYMHTDGEGQEQVSSTFNTNLRSL